MLDNNKEKLKKLRDKFANYFEYDERTKVLRIKDGVKDFSEFGTINYFHFENVEEIILPTSLEKISSRAFIYAKSLRKVSFAKDGKRPQLKEIYADAFYGCENLEEFEFCDSITHLNLGAFYGCKKLKTFAFSSNDEPKIIGDYAFAWCDALESVKNLNGLTSIGNSAFSNCQTLQSFIVPESCTEIGRDGFYNCQNLEDLTLSSNLNTIYPFFKESPKVKLDMDNNSKDNTVYIHNGYLMQKKSHNDVILVACTDDAKPTIPPETTIIGQDAFYGCTMPNLTLNDGLKMLDARAFRGIKGLKSLAIPDSVESIDSFCFMKSDIEELTLGKNSSLKVNTLLNSNIKRVSIPEDCVKYYESPNSAIIDKEFPLLLFCNSNKIPDGIQYVASDINFSTNEEEYHLPDTLKSLQLYFMFDCPNLKKIYVGKQLRNGLYSDAFKNCPNLTEIVIDSENQNYKSIDGCVYMANSNGEFTHLVFAPTNAMIREGTKSMGSCFMQTPDIERVVPVGYDETSQPNTIYIPNSLKIVEWGAFADLPNLRELVLPDNLQEIDSTSIFDCPNLEKIVIPANVRIKRNKYINWYSDELEHMKEYCAPLTPHFFQQSILESGAEFYTQIRVNGKNVTVKLPKKIRECIDENMVLFQKDDGKMAIARVDANLPQTGYLDIIDFESALENASEKNLYSLMLLKDLFKLIPFNNAKVNNIAKFLPAIFVIENLPKDEIVGYYKNATSAGRGSKNSNADVLNSWQDVMTKCKIAGENKPIKDMPITYKIAVFKIAQSLGMFVDDDKRYLSLPTICQWLNENILQKYNKNTIKRLFSDFDTYNHPYNKDFAILFINCIEQYAKSNVCAQNVGKKYANAENYQPVFLDFVRADDLGSVKNGMSNFHNNFDILLKKFDKKIISADMRRHTNSNYVQLADVEFCFTKMSEFDISKFLTPEDENHHSIRNEIIKDFTDTIAQNARYSQIEFETLLKWYMLGMKNYASARVKQARGEIAHLTLDIAPIETICSNEELANAKFTYHYLDKRTPTSAILGELSNCCQVIGNNGESCVKYGMIKPNSGFLEFRNVNGKFVGQGWVWYNPENKQVTIDNIEIPNTLLRQIDNLELQFKKLLDNVTKGIIKGIGTENVNRITIGLGCNDLSQLLKNEKLYQKYIPAEKIENTENLTAGEINILKGGAPRDFTISEIQKDGDTAIKNVYSDAREERGQVLLWNNAREKTKEK